MAFTFQHPLAQFDAQDLEYFENFTGIALNTTKEVEPDSPMCSFREFQVVKPLCCWHLFAKLESQGTALSQSHGSSFTVFN
jgi:hypothetical protein